MDKRARADLFRVRMAQALSQTGLSRAALARACAVDRSTISQLLSPEAARLPNAQLVAEAAGALGVSTDWLLGLTDLPEPATEALKGMLAVTQAERSVVDAQITRWHEEARGYKIRHVPATLPELLMTPEMLHWEGRRALGAGSDPARGFAEARRELMRTSMSDYEIAMPLHEIEAMARGEGYYSDLDRALRLQQIDRFLETIDDLYPALRLSFFDAREVFSAPITIFGPLHAVIYLGRHYVAFRDTERVRMMTQHFDWLVREARVPERDVPDLLRRLRADIA